MKIRDLSLPEGYAESKLDEVATSLYERVTKETEKYLREQLKALGVDIEDVDDIAANCLKVDHPGDEKRLCSYFYKDRLILAVKRSDSMMAIEFIAPNLKGEV